MTFRVRFPAFDWRAARIWERNLTAWLRIYKSSLLLNFGEPFMNLLALGFGLGTYVAKIHNVAFAEFIAPGLLVSTAAMGVSYDMTWAAFYKLRKDGIYDSYVTGPLEVESIVGGELLWQMTRSLIYGGTFMLVILALGLVRSYWAVLVLPLMLLVGLVFAAPALAVATLVKLEDQLFYYFSLVVTPMFMFSGIFFPVENLPPFARTIIWFMPLHHAVNLSRGLVLGWINAGLLWEAAWLAVAALALIPIAATLLYNRLMESATR